MKRTAIIRRTPLRRSPLRCTRTRIKQRSPGKATDDRKYRQAKKAYQCEHPNCEFGGCEKNLLFGDLVDLHHKAGRSGPLLYTAKYFMSLCRRHHDWVKENMSAARARGLIIDVSSDEVRRLRLEELDAR